MSNDTDILIAFGRRVRELRKTAGLSQESLARLCGLDRSYVEGIERGERNVSLRNIALLAKALHTTFAELLKMKQCASLLLNYIRQASSTEQRNVAQGFMESYYQTRR